MFGKYYGKFDYFIPAGVDCEVLKISTTKAIISRVEEKWCNVLVISYMRAVEKCCNKGLLSGKEVQGRRYEKFMFTACKNNGVLFFPFHCPRVSAEKNNNCSFNERINLIQYQMGLKP